MVGVPHGEKGPHIGLGIEFTIVIRIREGHGCARISSKVVVGGFSRKWWEVFLKSATSAFNDWVQLWGEDLLTTRALLGERGLEHAFVEIR